MNTNAIVRLMSSALLCAPLVAAEEWPQQGGPNRDGVVPATVSGVLADSFPNQEIPVLWKTNVGLGTSPVVATGNRIFTVGVFKPGVESSQLGNPSSSPTCDEAFSHLKNPLKMSDIPGTPDWFEKDDHRCSNFGNLYKGDEYAQCLDKDTGKIIWATKPRAVKDPR